MWFVFCFLGVGVGWFGFLLVACMMVLLVLGGFVAFSPVRAMSI